MINALNSVQVMGIFHKYARKYGGKFDVLEVDGGELTWVTWTINIYRKIIRCMICSVRRMIRCSTSTWIFRRAIHRTIHRRGGGISAAIFSIIVQGSPFSLGLRWNLPSFELRYYDVYIGDSECTRRPGKGSLEELSPRRRRRAGSCRQMSRGLQPFRLRPMIEDPWSDCFYSP